MYLYTLWHYGHLGLHNKQFVRNETFIVFVNSLLTSNIHYISQLWIDKRTFAMLCELLHQREHIKNDGLVTMKERVYMFIHILAHYVKKHTIVTKFGRFVETISRYFNLVLKAILQLRGVFFKYPDLILQNYTNNRWKTFKVCI